MRENKEVTMEFLVLSFIMIIPILVAEKIAEFYAFVYRKLGFTAFGNYLYENRKGWALILRILFVLLAVMSFMKWLNYL